MQQQLTTQTDRRRTRAEAGAERRGIPAVRHTTSKVAVVLELVRSGYSTCYAAKRAGVAQRTAYQWAKQEGLVRPVSRMQRERHNNARTATGRKRQERIHEMARMRYSLGMSYAAVGRAFGVTKMIPMDLLRTSYAEALRCYVFGSSEGARPRAAIARSMREDGYDEACIRRTLYCDDDIVDDGEDVE